MADFPSKEEALRRTLLSRLATKIAIVTGGGSGIGAGIVDEFRKQGAVTIAADVTFSTSTGMERYLDVTDESAWFELVEDVTKEHGPLGVLVNNAGTTGFQPLDQLDRTEWDRIVSVNQLGTYLGIKASIPSMRMGETGSIINISSMFGSRAVPALAAYQASKAAVLGITRNAAITYAAEHIRANAILPGWIDTPMTASQDRRLNEKFVESTPMQRGGSPGDIAHAAVYFASDESAFVTGIELPVDGGYLAQ